LKFNYNVRRQKQPLISFLVRKKKHLRVIVRISLNQYFAEKVDTRDTYPLQWLKINEFRFKTLAKVARSILCVPATSTASERLFSTAGLTVINPRSCLKPENVDALIF